MKKILILLSILALTSVTAFAQYTAKGVVVDKDGIPVIGAAVIQVGTSNGVQTGIDGDWTLNVPSASTLLEISFLGYQTVTVEAGKASNVVMEDDQHFLDEVVVIGYGTVKKSDMTGSVVAIKADEINRGAVVSPDQMLLGKVSGLLVTPASGEPGSSAKIRIRGAASLNASNDPLVVIDGVPVTGDGGAGMGNPLASVNPNDIETYSVLKDASATAIYGSRASNGVIIITTKKGSGKGVRVSYSSSYSVKQNIDVLDMMSGDQYRAFMQSTYPDRMDLVGTESTDWQKEIYRLAFNTDQNVSVYGGGKVPFRASLGYNFDQATLKTGDNQRGNLDLSLSPKFLDNHLSITANVKGIVQKTNWANGGAVGSALAFDPTKPVKASDGSWWNWYTNGAPNSMAPTNPLSQIYDYKNYGLTHRSIGNLQIDYKIHGLEDLRANLNLGYDVAHTQGYKYNELGSFLAQLSSLDIADHYTNFNLNSLLEFYLDYNHDFSWSNLDVMAGYSWQHNKVKYDDVQYFNNSARFTDSSLYYVAPTNAKEYYLISFFGRVNWSIKSKYLFTFTVREDASSRFSKKNRWGFFPSAAFAWNVANEDFLKGSAVSQMKLRLGWGRTGQQDIGSDYYPYLARYVESDALTMRYNMGDGNYTTLGPLAYNPNLKWETTETYNVGLDFGFANDRVTGTVEGYYRYTYDLLNRVSTPLGSNFSNVVMSNIGNMVNKGVEIALNVIPVETNKWHWSIGGNVTFQDTKITKLTEQNIAGYLGVTTGDGMGGTGGYTSLHRVGYSPYTYYLFQQLYDSNGNAVENGLVDRDGDGQITDSDRYVTGCSPTPWMYYGVNTRLTWKNWDFSINAHGSVGNYLINKVAMGYASSYSDDYNKGYVNNFSNQYLVNGWTAAVINNQKYSDMFIENASFFKIDDINLGYTFKMDKRFIKDIRLAASIQNVVTVTKYRGLDPEIGAETGVDNNIVPRPRLYTLRLSINF